MNQIIIKNNKQIEGISKSCRLAAVTLEHVKKFIVPGVTTEKIDRIIEAFIRANNAIPATLGYKGSMPGQPNYPKSCCISVNEEVCHSIPDDRVLKEGDIVSIDVTTILNGYFGDTCITVPVGEISEEAKHLIKVTEKCLEIGIKQVAPGRKTGEIGYAISQYALLQGCTVVEQFCGHGVGIAFHEAPQIVHIANKTDGVTMMPGMIFTIEPMINLGVPDCMIDPVDKWTVKTTDGKFSAQFEHTVLVTPSGFEILTLP